jgi:cation-transporting ATPase 13A2
LLAVEKQTVDEIISFKNADDSKFHFSMTGTTFENLKTQNKDFLIRLVACSSVFARMSPEQKQQLIEILQELGFV